MSLLSLINVAHAYGSHRVLEGVTATIEPGEKVGLVGRNGSGKTTLMKTILGRLMPDGGSIQFSRGARVGYLSQDPEFDPQETVRDAAEAAFAELHDLHVRLHEVFDRMASAGPEELERLLRRQAELEAAVEHAGGYAIDHRIEATLHGLGFTDDQFSLKTDVLSGGQKNRLGLARLLLEAPDLLLLDEPTNHLDIDGREWLEAFLAREYDGAVLIVSHDRRLLDGVVSRIIEIDRGAAREYPGNYHKYLELRRERMLTESRVYEKQIDRIRSEERFIARYKAGQRAKQARGRLSRLERFKRDELVDRPIELEVMRLRLPKTERSGDMVISAENLAKRYGELVLFDGLDFTIMRGERVGIVGPNGAGKSTLVRCLLGEIDPDAGTARLGSRVNPGFYRQTYEGIDLDLTVWQYLQSVILSPDGHPKASEQQARDIAGAFLFSGDEQDKTLRSMSGGERSRARLAGLVGSAHNLLVLDEPTNHLDLPSAERLEAALSRAAGYEGTLIIITHDRALLDSTCERLLIFDGRGGVQDFAGNWSDWREHLSRREPQNVDAAKQPARHGESPVTTERAADRVDPRKARRVEAARRREQDRARHPFASWSMSKLEERIEHIEGRIRTIDSRMLEPEVYTDGRRCRELQAERDRLSEELMPLEFEWSRRAEA